MFQLHQPPYSVVRGFKLQAVIFVPAQVQVIIQVVVTLLLVAIRLQLMRYQAIITHIKDKSQK